MNSLLFQDIFDLKTQLENINVILCSRIENGVKQLLALITDDGDIVLHYTYGELCPVLKRIPWFSDVNKKIQSICFDPTATWLLVLCLEGSLCIVPALSLVDKRQKIDCKWSTTDLTHFPKPLHFPDSKPTSILWWQTLDSNQNALVGFENGTLCVVSLTDGRCFGTCTISESIKELCLFNDNSLDAVSLLINGISGQQWKLVLEQHSVGYVWPPEINSISDESIRSRLQNFKQMSAEKLAYLKQKLTEARYVRRDSQNSDSESLLSDTSHSGPELLPHLCDTYFAPQYAKNRYLFSAFYKPSSLLTIHSGDVESAPIYVYKLQPKTEFILLTDRLIFTVNKDLNQLSIISSQFSERRLEGESEFNQESLIGQFTLARENEKILNMYKSTDFTPGRERKKKEDTKTEKANILPKTVEELPIRKVKVDTCVIVTNFGVYKLSLVTPLINKFVNLIIDDSNLEKAERLALVFALNLQKLFESCGDLAISNGYYHQGLILYKQAKIHILKRVLKLAVSADCKSLLKFIHLCLSASRVDMSVGTKIHLGNLAVMAYTELVLRFSGILRIINTKDFMNFLCFEEYYDQVLAVNVACQAGHWKILLVLVKARGLQPEAITAFSQILQTSRAPKYTENDFLVALSEPSLLQGMLIQPANCQVILKYIKENVNDFSVYILKRFALQLDPSQPSALPLVTKLFHRRKESSNLDSLDFDPSPHISSVVKEIIETFLIVLVVLVDKVQDCSYNLEFMERIKTPERPLRGTNINKFPNLSPLGCGYEHIGVIRNNNLYTMGVSSAGCLGLGPLLTQNSAIKLVTTLSDLKLKVLSVTCGRKHTLTLTDFGIYAWGSNYYGQLGTGPLIQESPYPQVIEHLFGQTVIDVKAGQYHSMALTSSGKVYCWGWGIHGQLGNGKSCNEFYPKQLQLHEPVKQISAGYAHSYVLTIEGKLYGFGSNAFGQLETCNLEGNKTTTPVWVLVLPDFYAPVEKVATSYFHNIAVTSEQEVYVWGASPQEVKIGQSRSNQKLNGIEPKILESWKSCLKVYTNDTQKQIDEVAIGFRFMGILHGGKVIWGRNKETELITSNAKSKEPSILQPRYTNVACGYDYLVALEHSGKLVAWGNTSFAQKLFNKNPEEIQSVMLRNSKGKFFRIPNLKENHNTDQPVEIPGLPTLAISFDSTDYRYQKKTFVPYVIRSIENENIVGKLPPNPTTRNSVNFSFFQESPTFKIGQKTLHYALEMYTGFYDYEVVLSKCLEFQNYQAGSKIAILDGHYSDSLTFQLKALKKYMDQFELQLNVSIIPKSESFCSKKNELNKQNDLSYSLNGSPARELSTSSSLDSLRQWGDEIENQGGRESPCELSEFGDIRHNMSQYVQSFRSETVSISNVSKLISSQPTYPEHKSNEFDFEVHIKDEKTAEVVKMASGIIEFYIKKTYATENHILMQNILMKCIEFWLSNGLPVCVLEKVLLKNMDKYFYPLSILLFCKNFNNNLDDKNEEEKQKPSGFLKDFSTKFCLQLCSMVLENVNRA